MNTRRGGDRGDRGNVHTTLHVFRHGEETYTLDVAFRREEVHGIEVWLRLRDLKAVLGRHVPKACITPEDKTRFANHTAGGPQNVSFVSARAALALVETRTRKPAAAAFGAWLRGLLASVTRERERCRPAVPSAGASADAPVNGLDYDDDADADAGALCFYRHLCEMRAHDSLVSQYANFPVAYLGTSMDVSSGDARVRVFELGFTHAIAERANALRVSRGPAFRYVHVGVCAHHGGVAHGVRAHAWFARHANMCATGDGDGDAALVFTLRDHEITRAADILGALCVAEARNVFSRARAPSEPVPSATDSLSEPASKRRKTTRVDVDKRVVCKYAPDGVRLLRTYTKYKHAARDVGDSDAGAIKRACATQSTHKGVVWRRNTAAERDGDGSVDIDTHATPPITSQVKRTDTRVALVSSHGRRMLSVFPTQTALAREHGVSTAVDVCRALNHDKLWHGMRIRRLADCPHDMIHAFLAAGGQIP